MSRFWTENLEATEPALTGRQARHLATVMRVKPGQAVSLTDGRGGVRPAEVVRVTPKRIELAWTGPIERTTRPPDTILAAALIRGPRFDELVRAAAELGFSQIIPFAGHRSRAEEAGPSRLARWQKIVVETAKQTARPWIGSVREPLFWPEMLAETATVRIKIVLDPSPSNPDLDQVMTGLDPSRSLVLVIGPEGGLTPPEIDQAQAAGFQTVSLGPTVFRTETAARVAATLIWNARGRP
jgi:16S rRNA (uracil1498-N3)-methyltransferase